MEFDKMFSIVEAVTRILCQGRVWFSYHPHGHHGPWSLEFQWHPDEKHTIQFRMSEYEYFQIDKADQIHHIVRDMRAKYDSMCREEVRHRRPINHG